MPENKTVNLHYNIDNYNEIQGKLKELQKPIEIPITLTLPEGAAGLTGLIEKEPRLSAGTNAAGAAASTNAGKPKSRFLFFQNARLHPVATRSEPGLKMVA